MIKIKKYQIEDYISDSTQSSLNLKADLVGGKVPANQLPSFVDDVIEVANYAALPIPGTAGVIYITLDTNKVYRWTGSVYLEIASGVTNLSYTPGVSNGTINSDTGTDATMPLADALNAGLFSATEKSKLAGIATGAEVNVNADWNATTGDAQILNKPTISGTNTGDQNLQQVTDIASITTNSITVDSLDRYSLIAPDAIGTENKTTGSYAFLGADGILGLKNGTIDSVLKNTNATNTNVVLEFPDKPTGSYTIATTSDVVTQNLQQVTDEGNTTTNDIELVDNAEVIFGAGGGILLDNTSRLREGTIDAGLGGSKGIAQICSVGYELKWEAGRLYVMNGNGNGIRESLYNFNIVPTVYDDNTKAYYQGSLWSLDNGDVYECSDATTGAAVWYLKNTGSTPTLQQVTDEGASTDNGITITVGNGDGNGIYSTSSQGYGVYGSSSESNGVYGIATTAAGVYGTSDSGYGVEGHSETGVAVRGSSLTGYGIESYSYSGRAISASSDTGIALYGSSEFIGASIYSNGIGLQVNGNGTIAIDVILGNSNKGLVINSGTSSTGNFIELAKNSVNKLTVNQDGVITSNTIFASSIDDYGVNAISTNSDGISAESTNGNGIVGVSTNATGGVFMTTNGTNIAEFKTNFVTKAFINSDGELTAQKLIKQGGFDYQFLKADGSVDNNIYLTSADLPSTLDLYATTTASDISGYTVLVRNIADTRYNATAVDVSTGVITSVGQLVGSLVTDANIISGNPGVFDFKTIGNISRTNGTGQAEFFFRIYKRNLAGTETLIAESDYTLPVTNGGYVEFSATALWNDGIFLETDRVVLKYYANRLASPVGSNPTYQFQFGGTSPVRSSAAIPTSVMPNIYLRDLADVENVDALNNEILYWNDPASLWEHSLAENLVPLATATQKGLVSTTTQTIAGAKTFTDTPLAPTPTSGDSSTKLATTAFVTTADNLKQDKSLSAYKFIANNTNATANGTEQVYKDVAEQSLSNTGIVWTGTTAPSGTSNHTYKWSQIGKLVTIRVSLNYTVAGNSLTSLSIPFDNMSDLPIPATITGFTGNGEVVNFGAGMFGTTRTIPSLTSIGVGFSLIRRNLTGTGTVPYDLCINRNSASYQYAFATIQYYTT